MDEVLGIIADAVSALVIAVADSEEKNTLFGDMVPAVEAIQGAVMGMVEAASQTLEIIDEEFANQIRDTTTELEIATQKLVDEAHNVRDSPTDRHPQREAIKAAKVMLQKTTALVLLEEMANIKVLAMIAKRVGETTVRLNEAAQEDQANLIMEEGSRSVEELVRRVSRRAHETKNDDFKRGLLDSCDNLVKAVKDHHDKERRFLRDFSDQQAIQQRSKCSHRVLELLDEVIEGVRALFEESSRFVDAAFKWQPIRTIAEDEVLKAQGDLVSLLHGLTKAIQQGDGTARARAIVQAAQREAEYAQAAADACKDPVKKGMILAGIADLKKVTPNLVAAIKTAMANPNEIATNHVLEGAIRETQNVAESLAATVAHTPAEAVAYNGNKLIHDLDALVHAVNTGDKFTANAILNYLGDSIDRHVEMAERYAESIPDARKRSEVQAAIKKLKDLKVPILTTARQALNGNAEAKAKLPHLVAQAKEAIYAISQPYEMVSAVGNQLRHDLDGLMRILAKGGPNMEADALAYAKMIEENARRQIAAAEEYASKVSNPVRKQEIQAAINELRNYSSQLGDAIRAVLADPTDKGKRQRLEKLVQQTKDASSKLSRVCQPQPDDLTNFKAGRAYADGDSRDFAQRGPVNQAVFDAAQEVAAAVKNKIPDDSPLGQLFLFSKSISDDMAALSAYAAQGNKKEMILAAKRIADAVKEIYKNARLVAAETTDPVLKTAVMNYANAANNYGTQLKIIAAVKAASDENDPTAEAQLVTCSRGLCDGVVGVVSAAESASIKKFQSGPPKQIKRGVGRV